MTLVNCTLIARRPSEVQPAQDEVEGARHHGLGVLIAEDAAAAGDDVVVQLPGRMVDPVGLLDGRVGSWTRHWA